MRFVRLNREPKDPHPGRRPVPHTGRSRSSMPPTASGVQLTQARVAPVLLAARGPVDFVANRGVDRASGGGRTAYGLTCASWSVSATSQSAQPRMWLRSRLLVPANGVRPGRSMVVPRALLRTSSQERGNSGVETVAGPDPAVARGAPDVPGHRGKSGHRHLIELAGAAQADPK